MRPHTIHKIGSCQKNSFSAGGEVREYYHIAFKEKAVSAWRRGFHLRAELQEARGVCSCQRRSRNRQSCRGSPGGLCRLVECGRQQVPSSFVATQDQERHPEKQDHAYRFYTALHSGTRKLPQRCLQKSLFQHCEERRHRLAGIALGNLSH